MWQTPWDTCRCCRSSIAGTPIAISAAVPMATTSAPRAIALAISADTLMPPVMIRLIFSAPFSFRNLRARYKAKIVGTFGGLHVFGGRSGSAGPSVYGDKIRPRVKRRRQVRLDCYQQQISRRWAVPRKPPSTGSAGNSQVNNYKIGRCYPSKAASDFLATTSPHSCTKCPAS